MKKGKGKKRKKTGKKRNWKDYFTLLVNGRFLNYLEIIIALFSFFTMAKGTLLDLVNHKETAVCFDIDNAQLITSLSNDEFLTYKSLNILVLGINDKIQRIKCGKTVDMEKLTKMMDVQNQKVLNHNTSKIGEYFWSPIILEVEYQNNNSNTIMRKYLYTMTYSLIRSDPNVLFKNSCFTHTQYENLYGGSDFKYLKSLPNNTNDNKVLSKYYKKTEHEFVEKLCPREEVMKRLEQKRHIVVAIQHEKTNGEVDFYERKSR